MVDKLQKSEGEYKGWTKVINNMRAVINTLVPKGWSKKKRGRQKL